MSSSAYVGVGVVSGRGQQSPWDTPGCAFLTEHQRKVWYLHLLKHTPTGAGREGGPSLCSHKEPPSEGTALPRSLRAITQHKSTGPLPVQQQLFQTLLQDPSAPPCGKGCRYQPKHSRAQMSIFTDKSAREFLIRTKILRIADFIHRLNPLHSSFVL